jgi:uridine phosphorylase
MIYPPSELILHPDGSIFHLKLQPEDIADTLILVGDPGRVKMVSDFFDQVEIRKSNREFITHTGTCKGKRLTVLSTGIGTGNIDIVLNELDALVNIDLKSRTPKKDGTCLTLVRIGTTGGIQKDIPVNSFILSRYALGFDAVLNFYAGRDRVSSPEMEKAFKLHTDWPTVLPDPCFMRSSDRLFSLFSRDVYSGITISAPGFYGPQGRKIRLDPFFPGLNKRLESFSFNEFRITNYEMESSALFGLSALLGHEAVTLCAVLANRATLEFTKDHDPVVNNLIKFTLEELCQIK